MLEENEKRQLERDKKADEEQKKLEARMVEEITSKVRNELEQQLKETPIARPPRDEQHSPGTQITMTVKEMEERDRKKKNIVIHGLPEPRTTSKEERNKSDKSKINDIIIETLGVTCPPDMILETIRLGKTTPEKSKRPRPVLTLLKSIEKKQEIFRNLGKLKHSKYKNIAMNDDMTQLERQQLKKMVDKAKELEKKEGKGQWIYRVRGPPWDRKIIKIDTTRTMGQEEKGQVVEVAMEESEAA